MAFDLDNWILAQQSKGYTDAQIEAKLLESGYNKETVDKALLTIRFGSSSAPPAKKSNDLLKWLGISFLIVLLLAGGAYYFMQQQDSATLKSYIDKSLSAIKGEPAKVEKNVTKNNTVPIIDMTVNSCGNNNLDAGEECDGYNLGMMNESKCTDFRWNQTFHYTGGTLACKMCKRDFSGCTH